MRDEHNRERSSLRSDLQKQVSRSPTSDNERGVVNKLDEAIEREVRPWLDLVDSLRAQGIQDELSLPQVSKLPKRGYCCVHDGGYHASRPLVYLLPVPRERLFTLVSKSMCKMNGDMYGRSFCLLAGYGPYRIAQQRHAADDTSDHCGPSTLYHETKHRRVCCGSDACACRAIISTSPSHGPVFAVGSPGCALPILYVVVVAPRNVKRQQQEH